MKVYGMHIRLALVIENNNNTKNEFHVTEHDGYQPGDITGTIDHHIMYHHHSVYIMIILLSTVLEWVGGRKAKVLGIK